ncbi:MAG: hypothetical protein ACRDZO_22290 [Egibacteraceae bacterium]
MIAVTSLAIACTRCQRRLPAWRFPRILGVRSTGPDERAQPCKDRRAAKVAASLVAQALTICQQARLGSAVMLLADAVDVLNDPDEVSQAGLDSPSPSQGDRPEGN